MNILYRSLNNSPPEGDADITYEAFIEGDTSKAVEGKNISEAIGRLVRQYPNETGINVGRVHAPTVHKD